MIKTFSRKSEERVKLFTVYSKFDNEIVKKGSELGFYLIGGTAIEIWLTYFGIKGWRKRSNNDIDFLFNELDFDDRKYRGEFFKWQSKNVDSKSVKVDWFGIEGDCSEFLYKEIKGIKVMHPYFLFTSKYDRLQESDSEKDTERVKKDIKDLKDILKIINKMDKGFSKFQSYVDKFKNKELSESVESLIQEFLDGE